MAQRVGGGLFRTRNILGAVLAAGIVAGVYLGDFWKGFGLGGGGGKDSATSTASNSTSRKSNSGSAATTVTSATAFPAGDVVKVVIANWSYAVRTAEGEKPIELSQLVDLAKAAKGDDDGIRVRIYRKMSSRVQAETDLENALLSAGIKDKEMVFMPTPTEEKEESK